MRGQKVWFNDGKSWKIGTVECISVDFPGYYAIFIVKDGKGEVYPVSSKEIGFIN